MAPEPVEIPCDDQGTEHVKYRVDLYVVANKYLVPNLCAEIVQEFADMLFAITGTGTYPTYVEQVARHIYLTHADSAAELRRPVVELFAKYRDSWTTCAEFGQLVHDAPEFAHELILAMTGAGGGQTPRKAAESQERTAATGRSKRKRAGGRFA